jgi:cation:H+ antiporter
LLEGLGLIGNVLVLLASLIVLQKASSLTIDNSIKVSSTTGLGRTTIGFILVAFTTSLPELFVAIFSVVNPENVGISIGNVLGSNIVNICLILGLCFFVASRQKSYVLKFLPSMAKEEIGSLYFGLFIASVIPLTLLYVRFASQVIGGALLAIFIFYLYQLSRKKNVKEDGSLGTERQRLRIYALLAVVGAVGVVATSYFIVESASIVAVSIGIPRLVIGATVIAFGTSIPELATSLNAVRKGHLDLALGNIVGSGFINITFILGITLLASSLTVNMESFSDLIVFSLMTNLMLWYFLSNERIGRREALVLLFMYAVFLIITFGGYRT